MTRFADLLGLVSPLLYGALLAIVALASGSGFVDRLVPPRREDGETWGEPPSFFWRWTVATVAGTGLFGTVLFALGATGAFRPGLLAFAAAGALLLGRRTLRAGLGRAIGFWRERPRPSRWKLALVALALAAPLWLAIYPPLAWDDTIYHLPLARSLAEHGRYLFVERLRVPVFPLFAETWFAPALLFGRASTAHGLSLFATFTTALLLSVWGLANRPAATSASRDASGALAWGVAPAALWLGQPLVTLYAGSAFVEPLLTLFTTAAMLMFEQWRRTRSPTLLVAAGAFAGWSAATKYLGLYLVAALLLFVLWEAPRDTRSRSLIRFVCGSAAAAVPWYLLIWSLSGNPLFPFAETIFGATIWAPVSVPAESGVQPAPELAAAVGDLLRLGWDLTVARARTNFQPPASPLLVFTLPLLLYASWRRAARRPWGCLLGGYAVATLFLPREARYLMPYLPFALLLVVEATSDLIGGLATVAPRIGRAWRRVGVAFVFAGLLSGPAYALWRVHVVGLPPVTRDAIDEQLARRVPLYRALLFRRAHGLEGVPVYALHGERLHDFAGPALLGEWSGPHRYALVLPLLDRPEELAARLGGLGARQLLLPRRLISASVVEKVAASEAFRELYRDDESLLLEVARSAP